MISNDLMLEFPHTTLNIIPRQLEIILESIEKTKDIEGAVVELGCHAGLTSVYIRRLLDRLNSTKEFHAYDSFKGLPEKKQPDQASGQAADKFQAGYFNLNGTWQITERFKTNNLKLPILHEGWFKDQNYPEKISCGFLDGDFYDSILDSLEKVWHRLSTNGIICIHDYGWDQLPGVERAVTDYFGKTDVASVPTFGLAVITKR
jgi:O-methyltransferase